LDDFYYLNVIIFINSDYPRVPNFLTISITLQQFTMVGITNVLLKGSVNWH